MQSENTILGTDLRRKLTSSYSIFFEFKMCFIFEMSERIFKVAAKVVEYSVTLARRDMTALACVI